MRKIFKSIISIICVAVVAVNMLACGTSAGDINSVSATKFQSELARDYKKIFDKEFMQNHLNGVTTAELISTLVKNVKSSDDEKAKELVEKYGDFMDDKYFVNDLSTYNWLATITVQLIKRSLNEGTMEQEFIDNINGILPLFGMNTISVDLNKHDYTDKDAEEIALKMYPLVDRVADEDVLRELGVDVDDPELINKVIDIFVSSKDSESEDK